MGGFSFARGPDVMNSKSSNDFQWCIRITGAKEKAQYFWAGITSKSYDQSPNDYVWHHDKNAITTTARAGDEIHCRFQPKLKKFSINNITWVRLKIIINHS